MLLAQLRGARMCLENETPLQTDCGALCGAACCAPDEDGQGGVLLFPGEADLTGKIVWGQIIDLDDRGDGLPGRMLICRAPCDRPARPLGCRLFPLTPAFSGGQWTVRPDRRAWPVCPLMNSGLKGLSPSFVAAARCAVAMIAESEEGREFLKAWARIESLYGEW